MKFHYSWPTPRKTPFGQPLKNPQLPPWRKFFRRPCQDMSMKDNVGFLTSRLRRQVAHEDHDHSGNIRYWWRISPRCCSSSLKRTKQASYLRTTLWQRSSVTLLQSLTTWKNSKLTPTASLTTAISHGLPFLLKFAIAKGSHAKQHTTVHIQTSP